MARKTACLPKGTRISDYVTLGVLTTTVPGELIDAVLSDTGKQSQRYRQLPARLVVYYVMALVLYAQASYGEVLRCLLEGLWCTNGVGDGLRPLCLCSGDLPGERHAEAGHAVDHRAGDPGLDLLRGQSPSPKAPADQNLVPVESGFHERALPIADDFLPAHSTLPGEHLDVLVTLSGLGLRSIAQNRV